MNYKEKYNEALERAKDMMSYKEVRREDMEYLFPELKESEDEKMRKSIVYALRNGGFYNNDKTDEAIAWLEKQGEQKSINDLTQQEAMDIADTKFKIGDWIVYNRNDNLRKIMQIYDIRDNRYYFNDNIHFSWSVKECDEKSHLWTIKDVKDGDVLACKNGWTCIFKSLVNDNLFSSHCFMDSGGWFCEDGGQAHTPYNSSNIHPATKEQRGLLFQKMKEEGYEWNKDKKELIKL